MKNCNSVSTPVEVGLKLFKKAKGKRIDSTFYKKIMGNFMHLTGTRPDIMHAISHLSRYMKNLREAHLLVIKRIFDTCREPLNMGCSTRIVQNQICLALLTMTMQAILMIEKDFWVYIHDGFSSYFIVLKKTTNCYFINN